MRLVYNTFINIYRIILYLVSPFNKKAELWYNGRKNFFESWKKFDAEGRKVVWIHCASLGEFEQGRPVIEEIKSRDRNIFMLLTFFSPSGYEIRKDYQFADAVCYLPADTTSNAHRFLELFRPDIALFVKYEFWYNYISHLKNKGIPLYLISANFRPGQIFFRWYGRWFKKILQMFSHLFVQDGSSLEILRSAHITNVTVAGDTRFDRVAALAGSKKEIPAVADFSGGKFTIVAGSTWGPDNNLWVRYMNEKGHELKLIIAPHEINEAEIEKLAFRFEGPVVRYSRSEGLEIKSARVLIIDNIGMLSSLYSYGKLAYIGGGFGKGIHNILEACTYGVPVIFGPNFRKFREASELVELGGAFPVDDYDTFCAKVDTMVNNDSQLAQAGIAAGSYVRGGTGATRLIVEKVLPKSSRPINKSMYNI